MITKTSEQILTILPNGLIQVRDDTIYIEDGVEVSRLHHRKVLEPGQDVTKESKRIQDISSVVWTQEVIDARKKFLEKSEIINSVVK